MSPCYGCVDYCVGCRWRHHFSDQTGRPCKQHTLAELEKAEADFKKYREQQIKLFERSWYHR